MNNTVLALLVGLLAGAAGGFVTAQFRIGDSGTSYVGEGDDGGDIVARLERIEAALDRAPLRSAPGLSGTADRSAPGGVTGGGDAQLEALVSRLEERLAPTIRESVKTSLDEALESRSGEVFAEAEPAKKKVTLAEAAAELGLTAEEEEAVRRIANETAEEFLKVIAGKDGNVDEIRREFEDAKDDPKKRVAVTTKYMGKVMANIGGLMGVAMSHETKMREALGAEKARKLDDGYDLTDVDPLGLETAFDFD